MPVGVEQWREAVGAMAKSAYPKPRSPIGIYLLEQLAEGQRSCRLQKMCSYVGDYSMDGPV